MAKVLVGLSGGVDSAVTALLLKEQGYDVCGVTLRTWIDSNGTESRCCEIDDAQKTAWKLGIEFHDFNCTDVFASSVTTPFVNDYLMGLTPNPCVICNRTVKFDRMLYYADVLGADYIATGHYAKVIKLDNGRYTVKKADHAAKDQTYMLYRLSQEQLSRTLMPLGAYSKEEVRALAKKADIPVAQKADSQEICFIPDNDYASYIQRNSASPIPSESNFIDTRGNILGTHKGIIHYTVGQRKGLNLAMGHPVYVKAINAHTNEIIIGEEEELYTDKIMCRANSFLSIDTPKLGEKINCVAKIRYHHKGEEAVIEAADDDKILVTFKNPVKSAAPGQSAVFYDDNDCVIGGGIIV